MVRVSVFLNGQLHASPDMDFLPRIGEQLVLKSGKYRVKDVSHIAGRRTRVFIEKEPEDG